MINRFVHHDTVLFFSGYLLFRLSGRTVLITNTGVR